MNKGLWTLVALALLLLASGYLLLRREVPAGFEPHETNATSAPEEQVEPIATVSERAGVREAAHAVDTATQPGPAAKGLASSEPLHKVVVRDKETRALVAGATVRFVSTGTKHLTVAEYAAFQELRGDWESIATRFGESAITDANGVAWLRLAAPSIAEERSRVSSGRLTARVGERYAETHVGVPPSGGDESSLLLESDVAARIRVVDPAGRPQPGVVVGLFQGNEAIQRGMPQSQGRAQAPDGIARLSHLHLLSQRTKESWTVRAVSPALLSTSLPLDRNNVGSEPLVLTVQPSGTLTVIVRGGVENGDQVMLRAASDRGPTNHTERLDEETSQARFTRLGLGATFRVTLERSGITLASREVAGPRAPDETTECLIDLGTECGHLRARLLDGGGQALARSVWTAELGDKRARLYRQRVVADEEGRVRVLVPADLAKAPLTWLRFQKEDAERVLAAKAPTPISPTPGELDLGDLRCAESPLLVAGTVMDEEGNPVGGGELGLTQVPEKGQQDFRNEWYAMLVPPRADVTTLRRPDGSFAIHGSGLPAQTKVLVRHPGYVSLPALAFREGQRDLAIVLKKGARVRTEVLCADAAILDQIQVTLSAGSGARGQLHAMREARPENPSRGSFHWSRVPSGTYQLQVQANQTGELLATLRDVAVPESGTASDPRLLEIDLRSLAQKYTVNIVDASGVKVRSWGTLSYATPEGTRSVWFTEGQASFVSAQRGLEAALRGDRMRTQRVRLEPGESNVKRLVGLKVNVTSPDLGKLAGLGLGAVLEAVPPASARGNHGGEESPSTSAEIRKDGVCSFSLPEPGTYRLAVLSFSGFGTGGTDFPVTEFVPETIEVREVAETQSFTVEASAKSKQDIAAWLAKRGK